MIALLDCEDMVLKRKILEFALKNWKEITIIISLLAVTVKTRMDYNALNKAYEISKQEMDERIQALRAIHDEELVRREHALQEYKDQLKQLNEFYEKSQEELEQERQKKTKEFEQQFSQDKEALANEIINTFNFEYME